MTALKASFTTIRYYTAADPYHYAVDNRPLTDVKTCLDFIADTMDAGFTTGFLTFNGSTLISDAANIIAQRNGTNAQTLRVYNTFTDATNYERGVIGFETNILRIGMEKQGTGTDRNIGFFASGAYRWVIQGSTGHFLANTDNTNDIGVVGASRPRSIYWGTQTLGPDGTALAPSYSFGSAATVGMYRASATEISFSLGNAERILFGQSGIRLGAVTSVTWRNATAPTGATDDLTLLRDAANILAQRNSTNAQIFRVYNTFTDTSNYERLIVGTGVAGANTLGIASDSAGTGTARSLCIITLGNAPIAFATNNTSRWSILNSTGHLVAATDNTPDIGAAGATRPRSGYFGSRLVAGQVIVTYSASMTMDVSTGNDFIITATNGTAFTINAPTNPVTGQFITIAVRNTSGGVLGAATWNAVFKMTAWTQPANSNSRCITFVYDGTNWIERGRTASDVPN